MMRLDAIREMIIEARRSEAAARPFPSGVAAGDNRTGFLNASEAGRCTRWLWYDKHGVAGETHHPYGVFDRGHAFELWCTTYLAAGLARARGPPPLRRRQAKAADAARLSPRRHARRADRMAGPVGDGARGEVARRRAKLRQRPVRNACSSDRAEHRAVSRDHRASTRGRDHRLRAGRGLRPACPAPRRAAAGSLHRNARQGGSRLRRRQRRSSDRRGRRHQAVRHLPLSQPLRRRPDARHSGGRHRRPRPGDAALHRSPHRRPPARRRSRGGGRRAPAPRWKPRSSQH